MATYQTEDGAALDFGGQLMTSQARAIVAAVEEANTNGAPVGIWSRHGWYTVCEIAPESIVPDPQDFGWQLSAVVDPDDVDA